MYINVLRGAGQTLERLVEEGERGELTPLMMRSMQQNKWMAFLDVLELLRETAVVSDSIKESVVCFKIIKKEG